MIEPGMLLQDRYRVVRLLGQGGMGAVYLATDERFQSTVAVKQTFFDDPALRKAFEREAQLLNHLRHAALPKVSDHFIEGAGQFLVMEFIEGADLSDLLERQGAFPLAEVLQWADELLDALDYLHTQQPTIVHRDIKPQNLRLTARGQIVLLDFGLAKGRPAEAHASTAASIFGYSRSYAPLEQIQGTGTDPRSDLYSLSATLYHLLTGTPPVDALTRASAVVKNQPDPLQPAHLAHAQVPIAVSRILQRALAQNAARRPQDARQMRAALRQAAAACAETPLRTAAHTPAAPSRPAAAGPLDTLIDACEGTLPTPDAGRAVRPAQPAHGPIISRDDSTIITPADAPRRTHTTVTALASQAQPPARKSQRLLVAAIVVVLAACAAVPIVLKRHPNAAPAQTDTRLETPTGAPTDTQAGASDGASQPQAYGDAADTHFANDAAPAPHVTTSAPAPADAQTSNAAPASIDAGTTQGSAASGSAGVNSATGAAPDVSTAGRGGLEIHNPVPSPTPDDPAARAQAAARRAEEAARRMEEMRRQDEERRRQQPPPQGPPPPPPGFPPPGHRPPPQ